LVSAFQLSARSFQDGFRLVHWRFCIIPESFLAQWAFQENCRKRNICDIIKTIFRPVHHGPGRIQKWREIWRSSVTALSLIATLRMDSNYPDAWSPTVLENQASLGSLRLNFQQCAHLLLLAGRQNRSLQRKCFFGCCAALLDLADGAIGLGYGEQHIRRLSR